MAVFRNLNKKIIYEKSKNFSTFFFDFSFKNLSQRTKSLVLNILLIGLTKILAIAVSILQIPVTLTLINKKEYGIWITIYSLIGWFSFFDLGIGNGLRNKLTEAISVKDYQRAKEYVSTAYFAIGSIFLTITFLSITIAYFVNWDKFLNVGERFEYNLYYVVSISIAGVFLNLIANLIHTVLAAFHKTGISTLILFVSQAVVLILSLCLRLKNGSKFLLLVTIIALTPLVINILVSLWKFNIGRFKIIKPSFNFFKRDSLKDILNLGYKFFIVQIAAIVLFSTDSFIIARLFSPEEVTPYFLVFRYFSVVSIAFTTFTSPIWSSFTSAYALKDFKWIQKIMNYLFIIWACTIPIIVMMVIFSQQIFNLWVGNSIIISFALIATFGVYTLVGLWNSILSVFVNSTGQLKTQFWVAILGAILNIPLAIFLAKYLNLGVVGVAISTIVCQLIASITITNQYLKFIKLYYDITNIRNSK